MVNCNSEKINDMLDEAKKLCTTNPKESFSMCKEAYDISRENNLNEEEGYALIGMALASRAKSEINKMLKYSYAAYEIFEALKVNYGQAKSLNLIGIAYFYNSMYEQALKYLLQAQELLEGFKDDFLLSSVLNNIGEVFRESGKYDRALEYYESALKVCSAIDAKINTASLINNIGEIYFAQDNYDKAFEYFIRSYNILKEEKDMVILGELESKLGKIYYVCGDYNKAEEYFSMSLKRLESVDNKFYAIDVLINMARLQFSRECGGSLYYLEKAIRYSERTNAKKKLSEVFKILADNCEKKGDYRASLEYFKKYHGVEKEIASTVVGNKLELLKIELDHFKSHHEFEKIKMINKRLEMEIINEKNELDKIQKINKVLEKKALEDELTGVPNRSYLNHNLNKDWEEALLCNEAMALFIIDIDNFKKYNDYWGHLKGDECLIRVANCLKFIQAERKDVFGRYGGEEFIYYAKGMKYTQTVKLGDLIRSEVEKLCLKFTSDADSNVVTISVGGVLGKPSDFSNVSDMIQTADKELYKAKKMGRNITFVNNMLK